MRNFILIAAPQSRCRVKKLLGTQAIPNSAYLGTKGHVSLRGRPVDFAMHATSVAAVNRVAGSTIPTLNVETSEDARLHGHTGDRTLGPKTNTQSLDSSLLLSSTFFTLNPVKFNFFPWGCLLANSPINVGNLELQLSGHPDRIKVNYVVSGFREGFRIGFHPLSVKVSV